MKSLFKNKAKLAQSLLWAAPIGLTILFSGQANAAGVLLDPFDSIQGVGNSAVPPLPDLDNSFNDLSVVGGQREMVIVSPGRGVSPIVSLSSNTPFAGLLTYGSTGNPADIATVIVRWDGTQDPEDTDLNFDLGGFDATGGGMNDAFVWEKFFLDLPDMAEDSAIFKMRAYSGDNAGDFASELAITISRNTTLDGFDLSFGDFNGFLGINGGGTTGALSSDELNFNFSDFTNFNGATNGADFTSLTAIEFEIMAPGNTDVSLDLLETGTGVTGPDVPEPGIVIGLAVFGLTGLLAKAKPDQG